MQTISLKQAVAMIPDGASLMIGGFMGVGTPERIVDEIVHQGKRDLTVIANDTALPGVGIGKLVRAKLLRKAILSHIGLNPETQKQMMSAELEVELVPQGTLIERIRAAGHGLGGILTPTGVGTLAEQDKQRIELNGRTYLIETALAADFALVHAFIADYLGNLAYALTARNFNPVIAMAGGTVITDAVNIVPVGVIAPRSCDDARTDRRLCHRQFVRPIWMRKPLSPDALPKSCPPGCWSIWASASRR
jgi:acetate CoA/acetoacetate CoA-transferase alpha subunit